MDPKGSRTWVRRHGPPPLQPLEPGLRPEGSGTKETRPRRNFKRTRRKPNQETEAFRRLHTSAAFLLSTYYVPGVFTDDGGQSIMSEVRLHRDSTGTHAQLCREGRWNPSYIPTLTSLTAAVLRALTGLS